MSCLKYLGRKPQPCDQGRPLRPRMITHADQARLLSDRLIMLDRMDILVVRTHHNIRFLYPLHKNTNFFPLHSFFFKRKNIKFDGSLV